MDTVLIVGTILMCAAAAAVAVLFTILVNALPHAALKGVVFVALMIVGSTLASSRLRKRLDSEGQGDTRGFTAYVFLTQFFLALAWAAMIASIVIMVRTG
jgi:hypothetical protein